MTNTTPKNTDFNIVESSIADHLQALSSGSITSLSLIISYLNRIAEYDIRSGLNAFTVLNEDVLAEAAASDGRRAEGPPRPLEGIPYTIKDSYSVAGKTVTNGSPALAGLMSKRDSALAEKLRTAGAILIGKTNMPPMAAGGMQRGLYGRAESPYNRKYLTAAFSSGSSNGAATSIASSMASFGLGSETVSSGRSPASNNALCCYTPSKGVLSCRGLWPLYVTCDVPVPYTRSMDDMLAVLDVIGTPDPETEGDFYRSQKFVQVPQVKKIEYQSLKNSDIFKGKKIAVPKMYIGGKDDDPAAKSIHVSQDVINLWTQTEQNLKALGAEIIHTNFPLVTNYENDSISGEANNVLNAPSDWNFVERGALIAKAWDAFLVQNGDKKIPNLTAIEDTKMLFPKPEGYVPDTFLEVRNWIDYAGLPSLLSSLPYDSLFDTPGLEQALRALEEQRKRDLDDWLDTNGYDLIAFPAQGDVGPADLEFNKTSTELSLRNGVKYSNGNRAIRHLGVPTVSVPIGVGEGTGMPCNVTFAGRAWRDEDLLQYAWAFENNAGMRKVPGETGELGTDVVRGQRGEEKEVGALEMHAEVEVQEKSKGVYQFDVTGEIPEPQGTTIEVFVDGASKGNLTPTGKEWTTQIEYTPVRPDCLGWDLKPLSPRKAMVIIVAKTNDVIRGAKLLWIDYTGHCR